jgi:uncharacterized protein YbjT (DUF2867 family)
MMASTQFRTVTIAGATGNFGYPCAEAFLNDGSYRVKILVRTKPNNENKKADLLASKGAEVIHVDYTQPRALVEALKGTDVLVSFLSSYDPVNNYYVIQSPLLTAAKEAGVKRFIPAEFGCGHPYVL